MKKTKSLRKAAILNTVWPGTGQLYLGQFKLGLIFAGAFGLFFVIALILFLKGAQTTFDLVADGKILEGDRLERIGSAYDEKWLSSMMFLAMLVYFASLAALYFKPPPTAPETAPPPPSLPPVLPK